MGSSIDRHVTMLELLAGDALRELDGVPEDVLNRPVDVPEANSLFAIATHLCASGTFWTLKVIGGRDIPRDREAEFVATGAYAELTAGYEEWMRATHEVLDGASDDELGRVTKQKPVRPGLDVEFMTVEHALLQVINHTAIHLGHIQVTKQLMLAGAL